MTQAKLSVSILLHVCLSDGGDVMERDGLTLVIARVFACVCASETSVCFTEHLPFLSEAAAGPACTAV